MKRINIYIVCICVNMFLPLCYAGMAGIWADDCEDGDKAFVVEASLKEKQRYRVIFCSGVTCILHPKFKNQPVDLYDYDAVTYADEEKMIVSGVTFYRCSVDEKKGPLKLSESEIKSLIIGEWMHAFTLKLGMEMPASSGKSTMHYKSNGEVIGNNNTHTYTIKGDVLIIRYHFDNQKSEQRSYRIVELSKEKFSYERVGEARQGVYIHKRVTADTR